MASQSKTPSSIKVRRIAKLFLIPTQSCMHSHAVNTSYIIHIATHGSESLCRHIACLFGTPSCRSTSFVYDYVPYRLIPQGIATLLYKANIIANMFLSLISPITAACQNLFSQNITPPMPGLACPNSLWKNYNVIMML